MPRPPSNAAFWFVVGRARGLLSVMRDYCPYANGRH